MVYREFEISRLLKHLSNVYFDSCYLNRRNTFQQTPWFHYFSRRLDFSKEGNVPTYLSSIIFTDKGLFVLQMTAFPYLFLIYFYFISVIAFLSINLREKKISYVAYSNISKLEYIFFLKGKYMMQVWMYMFFYNRIRHIIIKVKISVS